MICFTKGGPSKEHGTNKPPPTGKVKSLGKVKRRHHMSDHLPESSSMAPILAEQCVSHQEGFLNRNDWPKTTWKLVPLP